MCLPQILFYFRLSTLLTIPNRARLNSKIWSLRLTLRKTWFLAHMTPGAKYPTPKAKYLWVKSSLKCLTKTPKGQIDIYDLKKFDYKNTDLREKKFRENSHCKNFLSFQSCQMRPEGPALQRGLKSKKTGISNLWDYLDNQMGLSYKSRKHLELRWNPHRHYPRGPQRLVV